MTDITAGCASNVFAVNDIERFTQRMAEHQPEVVITPHSPNEAGVPMVKLHTIYGNWPEVDEMDEDGGNFYQILIEHTNDGEVVLNTVSIMEPGNIHFESTLLRREEHLPGLYEPVLRSIRLADVERLQNFVSYL